MITNYPVTQELRQGTLIDKRMYAKADVSNQSHHHHLIQKNDMTREEVFERIANQIGRHNVSCNCEKCKQMCQRTPCLGTPHDILALINAGYIDKVCYTEWAAGMALGHIRQPIPMVQLKSTGSKVDGCCICYHDGKCELHENGLKPTEGKLSHHEVSARELLPQYNLSFQVALEWVREENFGIIGEIADRLCEYLNKKQNG